MARRKVAASAPCQPVGDMRPWPMLPEACACGETLYPRPTQNGREWNNLTADGKMFRDDAPAALREDPAKWWKDLAENNIGSYSVLRGAVIVGHWSWFHVHRPISRPGRDPRIGDDREPPFCCKSPMRFTPAGWECRVSGQAFLAETRP
jgi:hypothetical protein